MTATPSRAHTVAEATASGASTGRRIMAVTAALGPLLFAAAVALIPYGTADSNKEMINQIADHRSLTELTVWGWVLGTIALVAGTVVVGLLAMRYSPKLGLWGMLLLGTGMLAISVTPSLDVIALGGLHKGVSQSVLAKIGDGTFELPVVGVPTLYFVFAHVVGAILLGVALLRGRVIAPWAAWVLILSMPLNVVGYAGGIMPVTVLSFVMMGIAFGVAGLVIIRQGIGWVRTA
ncbi:hypothetical protein [Streptomyces sp. NBC_01615]|uniref:hypothetical protein n=1 Tax=Streptomyces sp. NBC_01615 TaxID=2975898 RepID=UPI00386AE9F2